MKKILLALSTVSILGSAQAAEPSLHDQLLLSINTNLANLVAMQAQAGAKPGNIDPTAFCVMENKLYSEGAEANGKICSRVPQFKTYAGDGKAAGEKPDPLFWQEAVRRRKSVDAQ